MERSQPPAEGPSAPGARDGSAVGASNGLPAGDAAAPPARPKRRARRRRDFGETVARILCWIFALVGTVPIALGLLARSEGVQRWAAERLRAALADELGVEARYELQLRPWPLEITLRGLELPASDGGEPFLRARVVTARPRLFSLLSGKVDLGEVHVDDARVRAVFEDGRMANLRYRLPEAGEPAAGELPLASISLSNAHLDLTVGNTHLRLAQVDVDSAVDRASLEISLRVAGARLERVHSAPARPHEDMVDEDAVCRLEARARLAPDGLLVRWLRLDGVVDMDPEPGTRPSCSAAEEDWRRFSLELAGVRARPEWSLAKMEPPKSLDLLVKGFVDVVAEGHASGEGRVRLRAPAALAHRLVDVAPLTGWLEIDLHETQWDPTLELPRLVGRVRGASLGIDGKVIADAIDAEIDTGRDQVVLERIAVDWAGGHARIRRARIDPFAPGVPLEARGVEVRDVDFADLLDDLGVHPSAHVGWTLSSAIVDRFAGTLAPPELAGEIQLETRDFGIYDAPAHAAVKRRMMGVDRAAVQGTFRVTPSAIVLAGFQVSAGRSRLSTTVSLGYTEALSFTVHEGSSVQLDEVTPIADVPMHGVARVRAEGSGTFGDPLIEGDLHVDGYRIGGFPLGNVGPAKLTFRPLVLEVRDAKVAYGNSAVDVPRLDIDFADGDASVVLRGSVDTRAAGLSFDDFFEMVRVQGDPRFEGLHAVARGTAEVSYVLGGARDRCGGGRLHVRGKMQLGDVDLWGERYDGGAIDVDYLWDDTTAGDRGLTIDAHSAMLRKGSGVILARGGVRHGGRLFGEASGAAIPLSAFSAFQQAFDLDPRAPRNAEDEERAGQAVRPEGSVSFAATVGGVLGRMEGEAAVELSPVRIGPDVLPASRLRATIAPYGQPPDAVRRTRCGNDVLPPVEARELRGTDALQGVYRLAGQLFGGQIRFDDVEITQQKHKQLSGRLRLENLDLGVLANLLPGVAFSESRVAARLRGDLVVQEMQLDEPALAEIELTIQELAVSRWGHRLAVRDVSEPIYWSGDALRVPSMPLHAELSNGIRATLVAGGAVEGLSADRRLDLALRLPPVELARLGLDTRGGNVERVGGTVHALLRLGGTAAAPELGGRFRLERGMLRLRTLPLAFDDIDVDVRIEGGEVQVRRAGARVGNTGVVSLTARVPLSGFDLAGASATLVARDVRLPIAEGVKATANANLGVAWAPAPEASERNAAARVLPNVTGTVELTQFSYTRPLSFTVDLDRLTGRGRSQVETYDPEGDAFSFDVNLVSPRPLRIANNLVDTRLEVVPPGLRLSGTNQRFGARGRLRIDTGSKLYLLGHYFSVREGAVEFDNPVRIAPRLDVRAETEYRRYAAATELETTGTATSAATGGGEIGTAASTGGKWRIEMHAFGDTDSPRVRFTSDPPLSQDDILLLLQVGMTRAELDRGLAGSIAQTVGIEALSAVTGVDQAVRKTVPLIDDFRVGNQYSSRTGRPEPTVSVGKRLSEQVRASVTTGLNDNREVRSNVEWSLKGGVSVRGSYDNVNDLSSSTVGNVGADIGWRLEFE
jgi:translocation and assembly module TamB